MKFPPGDGVLPAEWKTDKYKYVKLKLDRSYVVRTLSLVNLAPDIIVAVMQGKTPPEMTLAKAVNNLPEDWQEQRELFGFA